jgi:hypothetical protein
MTNKIREMTESVSLVVSDVKFNVNDLAGTLEATVNKANSNAGDIAVLASAVGLNASGISSIDGRVTTNEGDISGVDGRVGANEGQISTINSTAWFGSTISDKTLTNACIYGRLFVVDSGAVMPWGYEHYAIKTADVPTVYLPDGDTSPGSVMIHLSVRATGTVGPMLQPTNAALSWILTGTGCDIPSGTEMDLYFDNALKSWSLCGVGPSMLVTGSIDLGTVTRLPNDIYINTTTDINITMPPVVLCYGSTVRLFMRGNNHKDATISGHGADQFKGRSTVTVASFTFTMPGEFVTLYGSRADAGWVVASGHHAMLYPTLLRTFRLYAQDTSGEAAFGIGSQGFVELLPPNITISGIVGCMPCFLETDTVTFRIHDAIGVRLTFSPTLTLGTYFTCPMHSFAYTVTPPLHLDSWVYISIQSTHVGAMNAVIDVFGSMIEP